jgi:hypothetical protein
MIRIKSKIMIKIVSKIMIKIKSRIKSRSQIKETAILTQPSRIWRGCEACRHRNRVLAQELDQNTH